MLLSVLQFAYGIRVVLIILQGWLTAGGSEVSWMKCPTCAKSAKPRPTNWLSRREDLVRTHWLVKMHVHYKFGVGGSVVDTMLRTLTCKWRAKHLKNLGGQNCNGACSTAERLFRSKQFQSSFHLFLRTSLHYKSHNVYINIKIIQVFYHSIK